MPLPNDLEQRIDDILKYKGCAEFIENLVANLAKNDQAFASPLKLFQRIGQQGFKLKKMKDDGGANFEGNKRVVYIQRKFVSGQESDGLLEHMRYAYAVVALGELMHHARESGLYDDRALARAIFPLLTDEEKLDNPLPRSSNYLVNSEYFHRLFNTRCRSVTGE